jgi:hypothetical protein
LGQPRALTYSRFLEILFLLECFVPVYGKPGEAFLIYRWKSGYFPQGSGPRYAFIHRGPTDMVTLLEISKAIRILDIPPDVFWQHADNCLIDPEKDDGARPGASANKSTSK